MPLSSTERKYRLQELEQWKLPELITLLPFSRKRLFVYCALEPLPSAPPTSFFVRTHRVLFLLYTFPLFPKTTVSVQLYSVEFMIVGIRRYAMTHTERPRRPHLCGFFNTIYVYMAGVVSCIYRPHGCLPTMHSLQHRSGRARSTYSRFETQSQLGQLID